MNTSSRHYLTFNSPNMSRLNGPLAESTTIGSPISQQDLRGNQKRKTISPLANISKQRQVTQHIEPHILTNAQSRGIVKRLVTYYDESLPEAEKPKHVYNKVGDFPIVHLNKTEIKRNLVRSPSVRIAPPNRTIMNRDIRAAILRGNSLPFGANVPKLMPTKMRAKEDELHQIITNHEPLPISEGPATAKSVLDALEKNCRKRINNEELTLDRNKRVCPPTEVVDGPSNREFVPINQSAKRGRDQISPVKNHQSDSPYAQLRKKFRAKNNALLSSLSSSHYLLKPFEIKVSPSAPAQKSVSPPTKDSEKVEPPSTQASPPVEKPVKEPSPKPQAKRLHLFNAKVDPNAARLRSRILADDDEEPKINFVKPRENSDSSSDIDILRHVEKQKLSIMLSGLSEGFESPTKEVTKDSTDSAPVALPPPSVAASVSISFTTSTTVSTVTPISTPSSTSTLLPLISGTSSVTSTLVTPLKSTETTEKTLVPSLVIPTTSSDSDKPKPLINFQFGSTPAAVTTSASPVASTSEASTLVKLATPSSTTAATSILFTTPIAVKPSSTSTTTASVDPNKSLMTFTPVAATTSSVDPTKSLITFTPSTSTQASTSTTSPLTTNLSNQPTFGLNSAGFSVSKDSENKEPSKMPGGFNFGSNLSSSVGFGLPVTSSVTATSVPSLLTTSTPSFSFQAPATSAFSFGSKSTVITTVSQPGGGLASPISGITGTVGSSISFGQKPETTTASGVGFSFNNTAQAKPLAPATTASSGISFGTSLAAPAATTNSFGFGSSNNLTFSQSSSTPAFPSFQAPKTESQPAGMFSFGQKTTTAVVAPAPAQSTFSFGGSAPATTQSSTFSFGQSTVTSPPASGGIFSRLGDKQPDPSATFSFGGGSAPTKQAEVTSAFTFGGSNAVPSQPSFFGNAGPAAPTTTAPTVFGGIAPGTVTPTLFGASNPATTSSSMFGSSGSVFNQPSAAGSNLFGPNTQSNDFGAAKPAGMFSFGGSTPTNQQQVQQPAPAPSGGLFSFGGANSTQQSNNSSTSSVFGNSGQNVSASFTFKPSTGVASSNSTMNSTPNVFGSSQSNSAAPAFGGPIGNNVSTSFTFSAGGSSNTPQTAPAQQSGFNFGAPQSAAVAGAFNFQAQPSLTPQPSSGGLFAIGTGGNQQQRRPIRTATRRMK